MTGPARVTDLVDVYVEARLDAGEIGEGHAANLRATLRTLARVADNPPAARLRPEHVQAWLALVAAKPAPQRRACWQQGRAFLRWLHERGHHRADLSDGQDPDGIEPAPAAAHAELPTSVDSSPTIAALVEPYLQSLKARGRIGSLSMRNMRPPLRLLARITEGRAVSSLSSVDVEEWLVAQNELAASTRRSRFSTLAGFIKWLNLHGYLDGDPLAQFDRPKQPGRQPRALTTDEAALLLGAAPDARGRAIVMVMLQLGLRCIEVSRLDLADWDRAAETITVTGKGNKARLLPVPSAATEALEKWLIERGHLFDQWEADLGEKLSGPLFVGYQWRRRERLTPDTISSLVGEWCQRAGIKRRPHDGVSAHAARHTAASDVLARAPLGTALLVVQRMLGHEYATTTAQYLRFARLDELREAMEGRDY